MNKAILAIIIYGLFVVVGIYKMMPLIMELVK